MQHYLRSRVFRHLAVLIISAGLGVGLSGCIAVAAGAGAGTVAYLRGDLQTALPHSYERVLDAARDTLKDLGFAAVSDRADALTAELISRNARDQRVVVGVQKAGDNLTNLSIRVGTFGDERQSQAILEGIRQRL
jgi:hypothetical protein